MSTFIADSIAINWAPMPRVFAQEIETDPAVLAGRAFKANLDALHAAEGANVPEDKRGQHEAICKHLSDAHYAAIDAITHTRATTLAGALTQLGVISDMASRLASGSTHPVEDERALERCLYSLFHVLAASAGVDPAEVGASYFMPDYCDPLPGIGAVHRIAAE